MRQKYIMLLVFAFVMLFVGLLPTPAQTVKEPSTGIDFPAQVNLAGNSLTLTGVGVRKRFVIKVYGIASYIETSKLDKTRDIYTQLLTDGPAKQLTLQFVRDVDVASIKEAFSEGLQKNIPNYASSPAKKDAEAFLNSLTNVSTNDQMVLHWTQGGKLEILIKGQSKGTFQNQILARGVWAIWLGGAPIDGSLKTNLVAKAK